MIEKNTMLRHYKGGFYTVIDKGTHSETLEDMVVYRSDSDNKVWIRPLQMFYEVVDFNSRIVPRFERVPVGRYGGFPTLMNELEVGTDFYVHNGAWEGKIVIKDGKKCILIKGDKIEDALEISEDKTLDITMK